MTEENKPRKDDDEKDGLQWDGRDRQFRIDSQTAETLMRYVGPHLRYILVAVAWSIGVIGTCYALSLIL